MKQAIEILKDNPYLTLMVGFVSVVGFGLFRLLDLLQGLGL